MSVPVYAYSDKNAAAQQALEILCIAFLSANCILEILGAKLF